MDGHPGNLRRRHAIITGAGALLSLTGAFHASPAHAASATRKNIDALTPQELEAYEHALRIVMQRGQQSSSAQDGYVWQAALHNDFERVRPDGSEGACEHRNELFFPWHRAHLAGFEFLLRAADPPKTADVALPYWDWTKPASGVRFPLAFEKQGSPLFHQGRFFSVTPSTPAIQWSADEVRDRMVRERDWILFAGEPLDANGNGGSFGWVEDGPHNDIHGAIGPTMGNPTTAARDPIYWSFHAFVDLIWARWQRLNTSAANPQPFTTPAAKIWVEPFTPVAGDMAQTDAMPAGYSYTYDFDFSGDGAPPPLVAGIAPPARRSIAAAPSGRAGATPPLRVAASKRRLLRVEGVRVLDDVSYTLQAYVHPPSTDIPALDESARSRYLAATSHIWMSGGHRHRGSAGRQAETRTTVQLDITKAVNSFSGGEFAITLLAVARPLASAQVEAARAAQNDQLAASGPLWRSMVLEER